MPNQEKQHENIVVIGGGAGGLGLVIKLAKVFKRSKVNVVLIDKEPTHLWKPLLHEVATGSLDSNHDEIRYIALARKYGFQFILGTVEHVDVNQKSIRLRVSFGQLPSTPTQQTSLLYDQLAIAVGSISNDFNTPGVLEHAIMLDSRKQAEQFHELFVAHLHRLNNQFLHNQHATEPVLERPSVLDIVIIGGGATGVELAADLHHVAAQLEDYGFEAFPAEKLRISILEGADRLLSQLPERISHQVKTELTDLGVNVRTQTLVVKIEEGCVHSVDPTRSDESQVLATKSDITVWAAGIRAPEFLHASGLDTDRLGRVVVNDELNLAGHPDVFILGDCAHCTQADGSAVPPRAQSAHQMAACVAHNIKARKANRSLRSFTYRDFGSLVSLSDYTTIGNLMGNLFRGSLFIEGLIARLMYRLLYRRHQISVYGATGTMLIMIGDLIHRATRSRIKLH